jgi:hypothetical protein
MNQRILLIEPNYKNKYPPLGLMKLATYHRSIRNDHVRFYKGEIKDLIIDLLSDEAIDRLNLIDNNIEWFKRKKSISNYIKYAKQEDLQLIILDASENLPSIYIWLKYFIKCYKSGRYDESIKFDRIYVSSLFTFHWNITVNTINSSKKLLKDDGQIIVGGVMATVASDQLEKDTGIKPIKGLLDTPGIFYDDSTIIDELPLDYSILYEIDYSYPEQNAYYGYTTRGCIRKCAFCAVPTLEPNYKNYVSIKNYIECVDRDSGPKCNLLLLDNNVLASNELPKIIAEIKALGFKKNSKFEPPNYLEIAIKNLAIGYNDYGYRRQAQKLMLAIPTNIKGDVREIYLKVLEKYDINDEFLSLKDTLLSAYSELSEVYEKYRNKSSKQRYVDYNQGVDARLIDENIMKQLGEIPIKPLRIAFDSMKYVKDYVNAIKLAVKYDITHLSNYVLYNYTDKPIELYQRLKINIELCNELNISIYSFPMKYNPINDSDGFYQNRDYLGKHWNRKFIRAIQIILNATKGKVGRGKDFFDEAFGSNEDEYLELLYMPEAYLFNRMLYKHNGTTQKWRYLFNSLTPAEKEICYPMIESNYSDKLPIKVADKKIIELLSHYATNR